MKNSLVIILALILVTGGVLYWYSTRPTVELVAPIPTEPVATTTSAAPAPTYIGLPEADAEALAVQNNVSFRVVERDGEVLAVTEDFVIGRINATVENGIVTDFTVEEESLLEPATEPGTSEAGRHDQIIGLTEAEATIYATEKGVSFRVGMRDGESLPLTMDLRPGRITGTIEGGVVTSYTVE